ncbi:ankyrin repeat domain-containing protein [Gemmatimonas phototrophica]|uniref:Ankyrin n=1 Tax=Gemmatimonas phototrophica TaxID=1379270 RepID=A0A143BN25_9BACT|nr:ankyrin repeat domain-containing protein [Gemmatimonas phototrophica]AMW06023.1 hypothetical protein GEMMAAP_16990 [Gemmatimonas phototrophica]
MTRSLSPKSSVDVLKQDAKRWLAALRRAEPDARARLMAVWPTAPAAPTLRDVQQALAREYGMADWKALLVALDALALDRQSHAERVAVLLRHGWDGDAALARRIVARYPAVRRDNLFVAAACGEVDEVRRLLANDAALAHATDPARGWTALLHVAYGRLDAEQAVAIAQLLLDAGADPNARFDDGWGNPFTAVTGVIGQGEGVKPTHPQAAALTALLLERGADPFDTQALYNTSIVNDDVTWTALLWEQCDPSTRMAVWSRVDGPALGGKIKVGTLNYLLGNAVSSGHLLRAQWLLQHGASANTVHSYSGHRVHTMARLAGNTAMAALLEAHGATVEPLQGERALMAALMAGEEAAVRALVATQPSALRSPAVLHAAASKGNATAVSLALELGAAVNATDFEGATALHQAAHAGSLAVVDVLLGAGAEVDVRERKWQGTPMSWACVLGRHAVAERLAPLTRDVRALARTARLARLQEVLQESPALANHQIPTVDQPTPLFCLPDDEHDAAAVATVLLFHGANPATKNAAGQTAEQAARRRGLDEAADLMAQRMAAFAP